LNAATTYALDQRRRRFAAFVASRPQLAVAELALQLSDFCRHVLEAPEAPAPHWLVRTLPPRTNALPEKAPELARARGAPRATPAVLRFADAPPTDMLAQLELVLVPKVPESMRLTLFKTEVGAVSAAVLLQESGVYLAEPGELTAVCAQHRVGCVVKGVVSSPHSNLRRIVAKPQEADRLDRDARLPLFYAQAGAPPGEVQLVYTNPEKGWPLVVLTHADGTTSAICVAVLLAAFELLVQRRGTASTRIALPAHPVLMRSPLLTSAYETYIVSPRQEPAGPLDDLFNRSGLNAATTYALDQRRRRFAAFVASRPQLAVAELALQLSDFCRHVLEAPEAPAPHWLVRTLPPRTNALPEKAPELARARGAPRATPAVLRFADAPPTDMLAQLELVLVPKVPESMRLTLFKTEVGAVSAAVLLQESGVYLAEPGELTAVCAQHRVGCVVKGVVSSPHSNLRRIVAKPQEADRLDRDARLPLFYAQAGAPPGEVQLVYTNPEKGWPLVVLTHADGTTSAICVAVLLAAFELLVQRRGTASTRIALPAHPVLMRSPLRTSAYETYILHAQGQDATVGRKRKLEEAIDLKGMEPGKAKGAVLSVWYKEGAEKVRYEGVVTSLSPEGLRVRFRGSDKGIYEVTSEDEWAWGGLQE